MVLDPSVLARLCRARALLCDDADRDGSPPIASVARAVGMSPFHFIRQFAAVFGATPHQYRMTARLERAKRLLATGASVTDTCLAVGCSSLGSFSQLFTQRIGVSPSAYRRRLVQVPARLPAMLRPGCFGLMGLLPADAFRNSREAVPAAARHAPSAS
ncbi:MAG: helix-turn-helix transcriptional regulator [Myxococcota bacterium]|nr:helix-turn-helix transcriptional regulator [Myxococcota bacterium]